MPICRLALMALLTVGAAPSVSAQPATSEALEKGFQALHNGDTDRAGSIFREALTRRPQDPQLLLGAGVVAKLQGQEPDAIALLKHESGRALDPKLVPLFIEMLPSLVAEFGPRRPLSDVQTMSVSTITSRLRPRASCTSTWLNSSSSSRQRNRRSRNSRSSSKPIAPSGIAAVRNDPGGIVPQHCLGLAVTGHIHHRQQVGHEPGSQKGRNDARVRAHL